MDGANQRKLSWPAVALGDRKKIDKSSKSDKEAERHAKQQDADRPQSDKLEKTRRNRMSRSGLRRTFSMQSNDAGKISRQNSQILNNERSESRAELLHANSSLSLTSTHTSPQSKSGESSLKFSGSNDHSTPRKTDESKLQILCNDLCMACWNNDLTAFTVLTRDDDLPNFINRFNTRGQTALYCASRQGHVGLVTELLCIPCLDLDVQMEGHLGTALHAASFGGHTEICAMLIYADASTTITNQHGMTYKGEALRKETLTFFDLFEKEGKEGIRKAYPQVKKKGMKDALTKKSTAGKLSSKKGDRKQRKGTASLYDAVSAELTVNPIPPFTRAFRVTLLGSAPVRKKLFNMFQTRLLGGIHVSTIFPGSLVTVWDVDIESENLSFTKYYLESAGIVMVAFFGGEKYIPKNISKITNGHAGKVPIVLVGFSSQSVPEKVMKLGDKHVILYSKVFSKVSTRKDVLVETMTKIVDNSSKIAVDTPVYFCDFFTKFSLFRETHQSFLMSTETVASILFDSVIHKYIKEELDSKILVGELQYKPFGENVREQAPVSRPNLVREPLARRDQLQKSTLLRVYFCLDTVIAISKTINANNLQTPVLTWLGINLFPECPLAEDEWNMSLVIGQDRAEITSTTLFADLARKSVTSIFVFERLYKSNPIPGLNIRLSKRGNKSVLSTSASTTTTSQSSPSQSCANLTTSTSTIPNAALTDSTANASTASATNSASPSPSHSAPQSPSNSAEKAALRLTLEEYLAEMVKMMSHAGWMISGPNLQNVVAPTRIHEIFDEIIHSNNQVMTLVFSQDTLSRHIRAINTANYDHEPKSGALTPPMQASQRDLNLLINTGSGGGGGGSGSSAMAASSSQTSLLNSNSSGAITYNGACDPADVIAIMLYYEIIYMLRLGNSKAYVVPFFMFYYPCKTKDDSLSFMAKKRERDITRMIAVRPAAPLNFEKLFFGVTTLFQEIRPQTWIEHHERVMFFKISDNSGLTLTQNRSQQLVVRYTGNDSDLAFFIRFIISLNLLIKQVFLQSSVIDFATCSRCQDISRNLPELGAKKSGKLLLKDLFWASLKGEVLACPRCNAPFNAIDYAPEFVVPSLYFKEYSKKITAVSVLGRGAFGIVQKAEVENSLVTVAVKSFHDSSTKEDMAWRVFQEYQYEAHIAKNLTHGNILRTLGVNHGIRSIILELASCTLGDILYDTAYSDFQLHNVLKKNFCCNIAAGLTYLHSFKPPIVHRDLRSFNVFISSLHNDPIAKIGDFGLSCYACLPISQALESWQWMAPEAISGTNYNEMCDVYSFGIVIYEIYTRVLPFSDVPEFLVMKEQLLTPEQLAMPDRVEALVQQGFTITGNRAVLMEFDVLHAKECVMELGYLPNVTQLDPSLQELLQQCWKFLPEERPTAEALMGEIQKLTLHKAESRRGLTGSDSARLSARNHYVQERKNRGNRGSANRCFENLGRLSSASSHAHSRDEGSATGSETGRSLDHMVQTSREENAAGRLRFAVPVLPLENTRPESSSSSDELVLSNEEGEATQDSDASLLEGSQFSFLRRTGLSDSARGSRPSSSDDLARTLLQGKT